MENQRLIARHQFEDSRRRIETNTTSSSISKSSAVLSSPLPQAISPIKFIPQVLTSDTKSSLAPQVAKKGGKICSITDESTEEEVPTLGSCHMSESDLKLDKIIRENAEAIRKLRDSGNNTGTSIQPPSQTYLSVQKRVALKTRRLKGDSAVLKPIGTSAGETTPYMRRCYATNAKNSRPGADIAISIGGIIIPEV